MLLADACLRYGEVKRAEELLDEALTLCERSGEKWLLPELHILMAEVKQARRR